MKTKILTWLKYCLFTFCFAYILFLSRMHVMTSELDYSVISAVLGSFIYKLFSTVFPLLILILPLVIKRITKCNFLKLVFCTVASILIYLLLYSGTHYACVEYLKDFTSEKWSRYPGGRHYMFDDLTSEHQLVGMSREELTHLLGEPTTPSIENNHITYFFRDAFLDSESIVFVFEDGKVSKWYFEW